MDRMEAVYGVENVESPANTPGARDAYSRWKDNNGNFILFGGGLGSLSTYYNDLWRYNPSTNNWVWIGGSSVPNAITSYGAKCIPDSLSSPRPRMESRAVWKDVNGNLWLFGGMPTYKNDLWMYCISSSEWIWVSGDSTANVVGNWGTINVASPNSKSSGRIGAIGWTDNNGHLYLFGGMRGGCHNDLWKYTIDMTCGFCNSNPIFSSVTSNNLLCYQQCTGSASINVSGGIRHSHTYGLICR